MTESIFTTQTPASVGNTESTYTLGTVFKSDVDGQILGIRYYSGGAGTTTNTVALYQYDSETTGTLLGSKDGSATVGVGWESITFDTPIDIVADQLYVAAWHTYNYGVTANFFDAAGVTNGHLTAVRNLGTANGKFRDAAALGYPDNNFQGACYFVDVIFAPATGAIDLVVANAAQAQSASNVSLVQTANLTVQNAAQTQQVDTVTLGASSSSLIVANAQQPQTAESPTLTQVHILAVQNARQEQHAGTVAFTTVDGRRLELQALLEDLLGSRNVYFQPPANVKMQYPAIVYSRDAADTQFAGNRPYRRTKRYQVTVIDRNPDSPVPDKVAELPMCAFERFFTADNLNHDVFGLYF